MPPPGHKRDLDALCVCAPERFQIRFCDLEVRVEQGAVDIDRDQSD